MTIKRVMILVILGMMLCVSCSKNENQPETTEPAKESTSVEKEDDVSKDKEEGSTSKEVTKENFRDFPVSDESIFSIKTVDNGAEIEGCNKEIKDKVIVVPETISGKKIVGIGYGAFHELENVEAIVLPDSVEWVGDSAFTGCDKLRFVYFVTGLKSTGKLTFNYCNSIKEIELPDGITKLNGLIATRCSSLETIIVPASVTDIKMGIISKKEFNGVIRTPAGSEAEKYCLDYGLKVEKY